jgi:hypothetical protein
MILRTRPSGQQRGEPGSPLPALLLTIVRSRAPCSISASVSSSGRPAVPKPPIITVAPSGTSASASSYQALNSSSIPGSTSVSTT